MLTRFNEAKLHSGARDVFSRPSCEMWQEVHRELNLLFDLISRVAETSGTSDARNDGKAEYEGFLYQYVGGNASSSKIVSCFP